MTEVLICQSCGEAFERERVRGRKPKQCPPCKGGITPVTTTAADKPEIIFKSEDNPYMPSVIDPTTGKRDPRKVPPCELEIPDTATEMSESKFLRSYDQMLVDGKFWKQGDVVKIKDDKVRGRYRIQEFVIPEGSLPMYVGLIGVQGNYEGKWRTIDPWRLEK